MATENLAPNREPNESGWPRNEFLELLAQWGELYAANYGRETTQETFLAYQLGLGDLQPKLLHKAFTVCLRECRFYPTVAEIRSAYQAELEKAERAKPFVLPRLLPAVELSADWAEPTHTPEKPSVVVVDDNAKQAQIAALKAKFPEAFHGQ